MRSKNQIECGISFYLSILVSLLIVGFTILVVDFPDQTLERAKQEGIVSRTILDDYNDHQESLQYGFAVVASPLLSLLFFTLIRHLVPGAKTERIEVEKKGCAKLKCKEDTFDLKKRFFPSVFQYVLPAILIVFIAYDSHFVSRWFTIGNLMIDEGCHLAWINEILLGKVLYRDCFYLYGPFTTYPAVYLMKIFGVHISVWRSYILWSSIAGLVILFYSLFSFHLSAIARWTVIIFLFVFYYPALPGFTWVPMRQALGLASIALYLRHMYTGRNAPLLYSGFLSGIALFYSQEIGLASFLTIGSIMILSKRNGSSFKRLLIRGAVYTSGVLFIGFFVLLFFYLHGSLREFLSGFLAGPRYFVLGWGALRFPDLSSDLMALLHDPSWKTVIQFTRGDLSFYSPIFLYLGLLSYYTLKWFQGDLDSRDLPNLCLLIFGILLFRSVLARSDGPHIFFVCLPSVILSLHLLDRLIRRHMEGVKIPTVFSVPLGILLCMCFIPLLMRSQMKITAIKNHLTGKQPYVLEMPTQRDNTITEFGTLDTERGKNLRVPRPFNESLDLTASFIRENTGSKETIFAFPNEAAFYFLTGRSNATSFVLSQHMITRKMREKAVMELIINRPRFVIFGLIPNTRVDGIFPEQDNPEVLKYLQKNYKIIKEFPGIKIGKRIDGT